MGQTEKGRLSLSAPDLDGSSARLQELASDQIATLALVINELATNAIKHAFEGKAGHISIAVHENDRRDTLIIVDDDGFALPEADSAKDGRMRLGSVKRLPRRSTAC